MTMEQWNTLLEDYTVTPDLENFSNIIKTVHVILEEDLATFELYHIINTLLDKPVYFVHTITLNRTKGTWSKAIVDAFKLLTLLAKKYGAHMTEYYNDIVELCLLSFEPRSRAEVLECLQWIARKSSSAARNIGRHVNLLAECTSCKTPLAKLIGTVCEYHPETVADEYNTIWRILLNVLGCNKNTDKVQDAVLQAIRGLFKHFGRELPTNELNTFYDNLTDKYIHVTACEKVCLTILSDYVSLFRERASRSSGLRAHLWLLLERPDVTDACKAIRAMYDVLELDDLQNIISTELLPRTLSTFIQVKYTALRILVRMQNNGVKFDLGSPVDVQSLEFELRSGMVTYETAEAIHFVIECHLTNYDKLLQTAIMFHKNLPANKINQIIVRCIWNAPADIRRNAIIFLVNESCQPIDDTNDNIEKYLPIWMQLFDVNEENNEFDFFEIVLGDLMSHAIFVIENFLEDYCDYEELPQRIVSLLNLISGVISALYDSSNEQLTSYGRQQTAYAALVATCVRRFGASSVTVRAYRLAVAMQELKTPRDSDIYRHFLQLERCQDEALLTETCLAIMDVDLLENEVFPITLKAIVTVFSRHDTDAPTLSKALVKLFNILPAKRHVIHSRAMNDLIYLVDRTRKRLDTKDKEARYFIQESFKLIGTYGNNSMFNDSAETAHNLLFANLKDKLILNIRDPYKGTNYRINLCRILQLAIEHRNPGALHTLMTLLCDYLSSNKYVDVQSSLIQVVYSLCVCHSYGSTVNINALQQAVLMCDNVTCVKELLLYIRDETPPGVRKMISHCLELLLLHRPESANAEQLVTMVARSAFTDVLKDNQNGGVLDIAEAVITAIKDNNRLIVELLTDILCFVVKSEEIHSATTFRMAAKLYIDKIELFNESMNECVVRTLFANMLMENSICNSISDVTNSNNDIALLKIKCIKNNIHIYLEFIKELYNYKCESYDKISTVLFESLANMECDNFERIYTVLSETKRCFFENDTVSCERILSCRDYFYVNYVFDLNKVLRYECALDILKIDVVLNFLQAYCDVLLELQYQKTLEYLGSIIENLTPSSIKYLQRSLSVCLSTYKRTLKRVPDILISSLDKWCNKLPLSDYVDLETRVVNGDNEPIEQALKIMLKVFDIDKPDVILTGLNVTQTWPRVILELYSRNQTSYLQHNRSLLTDLLTVSVKFFTPESIKGLILEAPEFNEGLNQGVGVKFCQFFIHVFADYLIRKPFLLLDEDMKYCCVLLIDVVNYFSKKMCTESQYDDILELVDKLWPTFERRTNFTHKYNLLLDLASLPKKLGAESNPLKWVVDMISTSCNREEKSRLVLVLPGGSDFSACYKQFASCLPTRLSEAGSTQASLRSLLDALSTTGDLTLLDMAMTLAAGDDTKGWWDEAIDSCMASLALKNDERIYRAAYARCWDGLGTGICDRALTPLLRYSSPTFCEKFFSGIIQELISKLSKTQRVATAQYQYHKIVTDYTRALSLLQIAFEKIPPSSHESPNSQLYRMLEVEQPWYLVKETCKLCVTLRSRVVCPDRADERMKRDYRLFQHCIYKCLCAAICRRKPEGRFYNQILDEKALSYIMDVDITYELHLPRHRYQRTKRQAVSVDVSLSEGGGASTSLTSSATMRTRMFLHSLSENPFNFDFTEGDRGCDIKIQDLHLVDNALNEHGCTATLTAVMCHVTALDHAQWRDTVSAALTGGLHANGKWLLAQAICNCKEETKPHANALRPALLALIVDTVREDNGKKTLNGLHLDILETLIFWHENIELNDATKNKLNLTMQYIITTCIESTKYYNTCKYVLDLFGRALNVYGTEISIPWTCFESYLADNFYEKTCFFLLKRITKHKIYIPELLSNLIKKLATKNWSQLPKISELFGAVMAMKQDGRSAILFKFRQALEKIRSSDVSEYIKILYYVQMEYPESCDEKHFKIITDLTPKVRQPNKGKCLQILSSYISNHRVTTDYISDMFDTIDLNQLIIGAEAVEAMGLVKNGLHLMDDRIKKRAVMQIAEYCHHPKVVTRKNAYLVMLKALEDLLSIDTERPGSSAKRRKPLHDEAVSPILTILEYEDAYVTTVLSCLGLGTIEQDLETADMIKRGLNEFLCKENLGVRFTECFTLAVYLPSTYKNGITPSIVEKRKQIDMSFCLYSLLEMFFMDMRSSEVFLKAKLREEPLMLQPTSETNPGASKLLTLSKTYQGTFKTPRFKSSISRTHTKRDNTTRSEISQSHIDVQVPIDNILASMLEFCKTNSEVSQALCFEIIECLQSVGSRLDSGPIVKQISTMLNDLNDLTPFAVDVARDLVKRGRCVDTLKDAVENLKTATLLTEGEPVVRLLREEILLRSSGYEQFVLGSLECEHYDEMMANIMEPFTIDGLEDAFGKLGNWDELTIQQKRTIENSITTPIWTSRENFAKLLSAYKDESKWYKQLAVQSEYFSLYKLHVWRKSVDKWPRKLFDMSTVSEAMFWNENFREDEFDFNSLPYEIQPADCLAEYALRLMVRAINVSLKYESRNEANARELSRSRELVWCERASEMGLYKFVMQCVERNVVEEMAETEVLPWFLYKSRASRALALELNQVEVLKKTLSNAETVLLNNSLQFDPMVVIKLHHHVLLLNRDLNSLTQKKLENILAKTDAKLEDLSDKNCCALNKIYECAMSYYDDSWDDETTCDESALLSEMVRILQRVMNLKLEPQLGGYVDMILNRLNGYNGMLEDTAADMLLSMFQNSLDRMDEFQLERLNKCLNLFPDRVLNKYFGVTSKLRAHELVCDKYKLCLQLLCDAGHRLKQYCERLYSCLEGNDEIEWRIVFDRIKLKIFENPYAGSDYTLLNKYKNNLYEICDYENTDAFKSKAKAYLRSILTELNRSKVQTTLRMSQLCPTLRNNLEESDARAINKLLGLKASEVLRFGEEIQVYADSIRRPTLITVELQNGTTLRYLYKSGENLRFDCAAQRIVRCGMFQDKGYSADGYNVIPLSDDCGLIQYLEKRERVRTMVSNSQELDAIPTQVRRPKDDELILVPEKARLYEFEQLCNKLPSYCLRYAIEHRSACIQDFIDKKKRFTASLASMALATWILGVGDRHLQNILYALDSGDVTSVDWGAVLQYGGAELPPARLTRNLVAVCDAQVLESHLQKILNKLRGSFKNYYAVIKMSFDWIGPNLDDKLNYIKNILQGRALPVEITRDVIDKSTTVKYKEKYIELLDDIFVGYTKKDVYNVEDQISCLLRQSTDPRILSVTRSGWEPWI